MNIPLNDPWAVAMLIILIIMLLITGYALRTYVRDAIVLAMALPPVLFKKVFGDPPSEDGHH